MLPARGDGHVKVGVQSMQTTYNLTSRHMNHIQTMCHMQYTSTASQHEPPAAMHRCILPWILALAYTCVVPGHEVAAQGATTVALVGRCTYMRLHNLLPSKRPYQSHIAWMRALALGCLCSATECPHQLQILSHVGHPISHPNLLNSTIRPLMMMGGGRPLRPR